MAHEGPPIDWNTFRKAGDQGQLMDLLMKLPCERWAKRNEHGNTLIHLACWGPNVAAVVALLQSGLDVDACNLLGWTPAHYAVMCKQPRVLEVLCAAGADLRARDLENDAPIDDALVCARKDAGETVRVLLANGVRLSTVREDTREYITPELEAFERGVLRCRAAVVAMLRVKRAGKLVRWDKFLLLEIAVCIWSSRYDKGWQT